MHIIPTEKEVVAVLRETGALREGHFEYPSGLHSNEYLQVPLAMRYYQHQRMLKRRTEPAAARQPRNPCDRSGTLGRSTDDRRAAGGIRRHRGPPCPAGLLGGEGTRQRTAPLPAVPGTAAGRAGGDRRRHPANRVKTGGVEKAAGITRRHRRRPCGNYLSAGAGHPRFRQSAAVLSGQAGCQLLLRHGALRIMQTRSTGFEKVWI